MIGAQDLAEGQKASVSKRTSGLDRLPPTVLVDRSRGTSLNDRMGLVRKNVAVALRDSAGGSCYDSMTVGHIP